MSKRFEEIDWQETPIGEISLRRRIEPTLQTEVYEVKLGDEYLMSSLFFVAEAELATLGLAAVEGTDLEVVVGGLGLGYTAGAALDDPRVTSVRVIEYLDAVIDWHERELLPLSPALAKDARCAFQHGDFFALTAADELPRAHAILLDIDHTPSHVLHPSHAAFYSVDGLRKIKEKLYDGGVFALWSDDPPDEGFLTTLRRVFDTAEGHVISFPNPLTGGTSTNSVYVAR